MSAPLRLILTLAAFGLDACLVAGPPEFEAALVAKRWDEAERLAVDALQAHPDDPVALADRARVVVLAHRRDQFSAAAEWLEQAIERAPDVAQYHFFLGRVYGRLAQKAGLGGLGLARRSRRELQRAVELEPRNFEYVFALNEYLLEAPFIAGGSVGRARDAAERFASVDRDASVLLEAQVLIHERAYDRALERLRSVPRRDEVLVDATRRELLVRAGNGLVDAGRAEQAIPVFAAVTEEFPNNAAGQLGLGRARLEAGDAAGALPSLRRAAEIADGAETSYLLGRAYQETNDVAAARAAFTRALEQGLDDREAEDARRRLDELGPG